MPLSSFIGVILASLPYDNVGSSFLLFSGSSTSFSSPSLSGGSFVFSKKTCCFKSLSYMFAMGVVFDYSNFG